MMLIFEPVLSLKKMEKTHCKNFSGIAITTTDVDREALLARLRCKMWSCEYCAQINRLQWRAHIIDSINRIDADTENYPACDWFFITLTAHKNARSSTTSILNLKSAWKKLYDRLRYSYPNQKIEYVWLFEAHKNHARHIHAIIRIDIPGENRYSKKRKIWYHPEFERWLKDNSAAVGAGYIAHAAKIHDSNAGLVAAYIVKYMTKDAQNIGATPKNFRRISTSRGFGAMTVPKSEVKWEYRAHITKHELRLHSKITDVSTGHVVTAKDFEKSEIYPIATDYFAEWKRNWNANREYNLDDS